MTKVKLIQKTLYLYEEDVDTFMALPNKTKWAHNSLKSAKPNPLQSPVVLDPSLEPHAALDKTVKTSELKLCKHGKIPEFCRFAKNGKPCK